MAKVGGIPWRSMPGQAQQSGWMSDTRVTHPLGGRLKQIGCPVDLSGDSCRNDGCVNNIGWWGPGLGCMASYGYPP